jgi:hypothetical protein
VREAIICIIPEINRLLALTRDGLLLLPFDLGLVAIPITSTFCMSIISVHYMKYSDNPFQEAVHSDGGFHVSRSQIRVHSHECKDRTEGVYREVCNQTRHTFILAKCVCRCMKTQSKGSMITLSKRVSNRDSATPQNSFQNTPRQTLTVKCRSSVTLLNLDPI